MNTSGDNNRSVRFTKARIKEGFFTLLKEKSVHKISVSELVKEANVSRAKQLNCLSLDKFIYNV